MANVSLHQTLIFWSASVEEEDAFQRNRANPREREGREKKDHRKWEFPRVEANLTSEISNDT